MNFLGKNQDLNSPRKKKKTIINSSLYKNYNFLEKF